jgi:DNA mismatch repair protein MSH5
MIVTELEENILDAENELRDCFNALSRLDCILSFANCAADLNFTRPHLIDDDNDAESQSEWPQQQQQRRQVICIKDGRHPLQELICEREFVRNDVEMDDLNRVLCITGPNYSGKSCYMRQVGLLVYMAHLGSFIPCSKAIISITDQIFARVSTMETCSRPQSSYQLELTEMASILLKATPRSLVLIDEFGKGTNPASGIAILGAALKKLSNIRCKTVCTTHFLELFTMKLIIDGRDGIRALRMTIHLPEGEEDGASSLFKLEDGIASSSAGLVCAKNAGVAHSLTDRAKEIIQSIRARKTIRPLPEATNEIPMILWEEKRMLQHFLSNNSWELSNDDDIMKLVQLLVS